MPAKNMLNSVDDLSEPAAHVANQRLRQTDHAVGHVRRRHQLADEQEERDRQQDLGIDAVEHLPTIDCMLIGVRLQATRTPAISAKATGTPM